MMKMTFGRSLRPLISDPAAVILLLFPRILRQRDAIVDTVLLEAGMRIDLARSNTPISRGKKEDKKKENRSEFGLIQYDM
jgi:hypothetical protein